MTKKTATTVVAALAGLLVVFTFTAGIWMPRALWVALGAGVLIGIPVGVLAHRDQPTWTQTRRNRPRLPL